MQTSIHLTIPRTSYSLDELSVLQRFLAPPTEIFLETPIHVQWRIAGKINEAEAWMVARHIADMTGMGWFDRRAARYQSIYQNREYSVNELALLCSFPPDLAELLRSKSVLWMRPEDKKELYIESYRRLKYLGVGNPKELLATTSLVSKQYPWDFVEDWRQFGIWLRTCPPGLNMSIQKGYLVCDKESAISRWNSLGHDLKINHNYLGEIVKGGAIKMRLGAGVGAYTRPK